MSSLRLCCVVLSLLWAVSGFAKTDTATALKHVNAANIQLYQTAREIFLQQLSATVLISGDSLRLNYRGKHYDKPLMLPDTAALDAIARIPYGVFALFSMRNTASGMQETLAIYLKRLQVLADSNPESLSRDPRVQQAIVAIVTHSIAIIKNTIDTAQFSDQRYKQYFHAMGIEMGYVIQAAAQVELYYLQAVVSDWRKIISPQDWSRVIVIVGASKMAAPGNLYAQFFQKLFATPVGGWRLMVTENEFNLAGLQRVLGDYYLDAALSKVLFDNPNILHRDIYATSAKKVLSGMVLTKKHDSAQAN